MPPAAPSLALVAAAAAAAATAAGETDAQRLQSLGGAPIRNMGLIPGGRGVQEGWEGWTLFLQPDPNNTSADALCQANPLACAMAGRPGPRGFPFITLRGSRSDVETLLRSQEGRVKVEFAEPDLFAQVLPKAVSDGPPPAASDHSCSWGLDRIGARRDGEPTGRGAHIYMLGTGIRCSHVEFGGRCASALDYSGGTAVECYGRTQCAEDPFGHGTHGAAVAGGSVCGVAAQATVHAVKVAGPHGMGRWSWIVSALDWIASRGAQPAVASIAFGGAGRLDAVRRAIELATKAGVTVVAAAGDGDEEVAPIPLAVLVGASDHRNYRAGYSNFGRGLALYAPGSAITAAWSKSDTSAMTMSGTSPACAHAAGAAAVLLGQESSLVPRDVVERLAALAAKDQLSGLRAGDPNLLLRVSRHTDRSMLPMISTFIDVDGLTDAPGLQRLAALVVMGALVAGSVFGGIVAFRAVRTKVSLTQSRTTTRSMRMELASSDAEGALLEGETTTEHMPGPAAAAGDDAGALLGRREAAEGGMEWL